MERGVGTVEPKRVRACFTRALPTYDREARAQHRICERLASFLPDEVAAGCRRVLEIGCGTGSLTRLVRPRCAKAAYVANDLCESCRPAIERLFPEAPVCFLAGDAERVAFPGRFDLVVSASAFQWMQDLRGFFHRLAGLLQPGGCLLFNTFLPDNLFEIRTLTGRGLDYPTAAELGLWLSSDFEVKRCEEETIRLTFASPVEVLRHLKATGVTATGNHLWTKGRLEQFRKQYIEQFSTPDGCVTLTYRPVYFVAIKK